MKERPILFSAPMVRAILSGQKTQTRRVVKPIPEMVSDGKVVTWEGDASALMRLFDQVGRSCPYGQSGDRLWVRETWSVASVATPTMAIRDKIVYRADFSEDYDMFGIPSRRWFPSIHMKRADSRILLEVTGVRVERLADISKDDAMAEGIVLQPDGGFGLADSTHYNFSDPTDSYCSLWESINGAGSWMGNPWVWVVEFKERVA